ncbi:K02A2.6-like [Cordylochernes scorpioides]|uniref:RNA-directed DNA polymerase n=1 Tax=Cordylochernes scorpioides TaxID=51811 RepID=A0ABY6LGI9_9ARAC|nr:K02A2.6-like [Cordylochernes scorpioides]
MSIFCKAAAIAGHENMWGACVIKPIVYGNIAQYFGKKREEDGHTHKWTVYLKPFFNEDMSTYVKKVHFKLHESYANQNRGKIFQGLISTLQLVEKLDRYPFRKKRKIDSVEQEEKTMNIKKEATTQGVEDPRSWLKGYERVAKHNQWDETLCLANVYFYLTGTALKWYENNEESIQTWTEFMSQLENVFGKNESSRLRAEKILKTRAQLKGESTEYYIQDVLRLCKEVDPQMNEEDKISHLMKGIAEELYQALIPRDVHNTEQFVTECRRIESIHCKRVTPTKYERLPNVASLSDHDDRADLSSMIRQIVREEVQRALGSSREEPKISTIEDMVKEEIGRTLAPISKPRRSSPQKERPREFYNNRYVAQTIRPQQPKQVNGRRDTNEWRTTEGKPICFHCGRPGHVVRYCRDKRREYEGEQTWNYKQRDRLEPRTFYNSRSSQEPNDDLPRENRRRYRSPSPYTGRKGQYSAPDRRPSQSPRRSQLKENYIDIKIEGKMTRALVDSGASYSVISERFRLKLRKIMFAETDVTLRVANGKIVRPKGRCTLKLDLNGLQESFEFVVMEDCSHEVILGWNFLKLSRAIIDSADDTLFLEKCLFEDTPKNSSPLYSELEYRIEPASIQLIEVASRDISNDAIVVAECRKELLLERELTAPSSVISLTNNRGKLWVVNWSPYPKLIPQGMHVADSAVIEDSQLCTLADCNQVETEAEHSEDPKISEFFIDDSLVESQKEKLRNLLKNYTDIFEFSKRKQFKDVNVKHRINTGDHLPTKQRPYRVAPRERQIIQDEVNKMEKLDIIQPSESPWASPVVLIRKKDGSWRFCVDYRRLNKITKKDVYPLPRIDDTLDCLRGARFYSSMDLQSGYWQIDVEESDREKTAFITPDGLYEFKVMPFGLCNAPATFKRMIDNLLKGLKWTICLCYLDDIIVFSDGFEEHLRRLQLVLNCLKKAGLCLNSKKCKFGAKTITVLGHEVSENGIRPDQEKIRAVRDFATPRSLKEVRSFLGLSSYYRRFIPNYAHVAQPLNDLLKKDSAFNWNQEEQNAFEALKSALISEPALGHFDYSSPTEIHTDASNYGIGAVLVQIQKGKERAIAYASRTLNKAEKNYSTTERECLAIIWAINKFRPYVFGQPFTIVTDHHSLCWLTNLKDPCGRLARWALRLQEFDVTVVYKSGRKHQDADCLSRSPLEYSEDMEEDIPSIVTLQNFSEEQMNDQAIRKIADKLQSSPNNSFVKIDNTLYRKNYDPMGKPWLLVVPRHLRQELLKNFHDSPTAGHLGFTKTYDRIRKKYYWPGMYRTVRRYVAHCSDCQRRKHQPQLPSGHLQPIPVPEVAFEKVGMDLLGRFPTSEGGNRWIIVCTDYLTKYAITKALPTSESMEVAKFFIEDVILKHGAPRELITDRGRNFTSSMISDLNNQCRITHRKTTAYHPQTNGLTERLNKTIADMLSMYVDVNHKDWDRILPFVTFAYNTAKQESTGFTPFFLVHGREAETPLDVLFPKLLPEDDDFIQTLGARAEEARKLARIHSMRSQGSNKHRYDAHHRNIIYQPGDLVWIFIPVRKVGYSEKLMRRYFGPYKVTRKISDVTYEVETFGNQLGRRKTKDLVHIGRMKPYLNPEDQEDQLEEDPEDDSTNFQEEDIPTERTQQPQTREEISGPITRSRALRLRITTGGALNIRQHQTTLTRFRTGHLKPLKIKITTKSTPLARNKPPYEVTETGWGEFEIAIKIYFIDPNERPVSVYHVLKLFQNEANFLLGKKHLVSEFYDELIFQEPLLSMHQALTNTPPLIMGPYQHETNFEEKKERTLAAILSAKSKIQKEIADLKEKLTVSKESIAKFREAITKLEQGDVPQA